MSDLAHLDEEGRVSMVDITEKSTSYRRARARAVVEFPEGELTEILEEGLEKGELFATIRLAGIQAAKKTPELIPLTHPINLSHVQVEICSRPVENLLKIEVTASARDATGVEMEALTGASAAALTAYDMCKGRTKGIKIKAVKLLEKEGGASGDWQASELEEK